MSEAAIQDSQITVLDADILNIGEGCRDVRIPRPFNARAVRESARIKADLHNQVRRFSSGMTLADGGHMRLPAKWGSGHG